MARPHIEFIQSGDVPFEPIADGPFAAARRRLLSEDDETAASTSIVAFDPDADYELAGYDRPIEIFVLSGDLRVASERLTDGCYAYLPPTRAARTVSAAEPSQALVMIEPATDVFSDEPVTVTDTTGGRWQEPGLEADVPPGILIKLLRLDPENGDWTWVAGTVPGWEEQRAEIHPTVEECLMLRGDILLGERGAMTAGSYFWRPPMVHHGPMFTRNGGLFFFRTKGGGMDVTWEQVRGWRELVQEYVAQDSYYQGQLD